MDLKFSTFVKKCQVTARGGGLTHTVGLLDLLNSTAVLCAVYYVNTDSF